VTSDINRPQSSTSVDAGQSETGEYVPAGEAQGQDARFTAEHVAGAFGVDVNRVHNALQGEFDLGPDATVDSRQAQQLAEVIIGDQPLDQQQAALMALGAFTPRTDEDYGRGQGKPSEESDKLEDRTPRPGII
jgi:hypothetical protein